MNKEKNQIELGEDSSLIDERCQALCLAIKDSAGYIRYHKALEKLKVNKKLFAIFNEFRQKSLIIELNPEENKYTGKEELYAEYKDLLVDPDVSEFLTAEQQMCLMVRGIHERIAEVVDMDLSYM